MLPVRKGILKHRLRLNFASLNESSAIGLRLHDKSPKHASSTPIGAGTRSRWIFGLDHRRPGTFDVSTPVRSGLATHPTNGQRHFRNSSIGTFRSRYECRQKPRAGHSRSQCAAWNRSMATPQRRGLSYRTPGKGSTFTSAYTALVAIDINTVLSAVYRHTQRT